MIFGDEVGCGFVTVDNSDDDFVWILTGTETKIMGGKCCFAYGAAALTFTRGRSATSDK